MHACTWLSPTAAAAASHAASAYLNQRRRRVCVCVCSTTTTSSLNIVDALHQRVCGVRFHCSSFERCRLRPCRSVWCYTHFPTHTHTQAGFAGCCIATNLAKNAPNWLDADVGRRTSDNAPARTPTKSACIRWVGAVGAGFTRRRI